MATGGGSDSILVHYLLCDRVLEEVVLEAQGFGDLVELIQAQVADHVGPSGEFRPPFALEPLPQRLLFKLSLVLVLVPRVLLLGKGGC